MISRDEIRRHFTDFRYMSSIDKPNILEEFVRYEEVVDYIQSLTGPLTAREALSLMSECEQGSEEYIAARKIWQKLQVKESLDRMMDDIKND